VLKVFAAVSSVVQSASGQRRQRKGSRSGFHCCPLQKKVDGSTIVAMEGRHCPQSLVLQPSQGSLRPAPSKCCQLSIIGPAISASPLVHFTCMPIPYAIWWTPASPRPQPWPLHGTPGETPHNMPHEQTRGCVHVWALKWQHSPVRAPLPADWPGMAWTTLCADPRHSTPQHATARVGPENKLHPKARRAQMVPPAQRLPTQPQ
jgi:hypothetical protein